MAAYPFAVVDQAIRAHAPFPGTKRRPATTTASTAPHSGTSQQAVVGTALLLERMGLSPEDLVAVPRERPVVPTFAEYVPVVSAAVTVGTRRAYGSYWNRVIEHWGDRRLDEINQVAATTGDGPELDTLRLHTEKPAAAAALSPCARKISTPDQCLIMLREKGETVRWQPVSPTLMTRLLQHVRERHAPQDGQLLRYASGQPITSRRYDHL
jgi:hypothetical protein